MGADGDTFHAGLVAAARAMVDAKRELGRLDAAAGDGDLGATMERGFAAVLREFESSAPDGAGSQVRRMGELLCSEAPSTMGTLLGTALMMASPSLDDGDVTGDAVASFLGAAADAIARLGNVEEGQRTVLDALGPSAAAARTAVEGGAGLADVLIAASVAADEGARATAEMAPTVGRARWTAQSAKGVVDGGAMAWAIWLGGLAAGMSAGG